MEDIKIITTCCLSSQRKSTRTNHRLKETAVAMIVASIIVAARVPSYRKNEELSGLTVTVALIHWESERAEFRVLGVICMR